MQAAWSGYAPGHRRRIVSEPETPVRTKQNDAAVSAESVIEIRDGFACGDFRGCSRSDAIGSPLAQHKLHNRLAPACERNSSRKVIGIAAAADQR